MTETSYLSKVLDRIASDLDLSEEMVDRAILTYETIADWLGADDSNLSMNRPEIYPQGSFRLGTPVRPIRESDDYDIDLVCRLQIAKRSITQKELKKRIGDRLKQNRDWPNPPSENRRSWALRFEGFHLDVLPAIPDDEYGATSILIPDRELYSWQHSNPIGYCDWFVDKMKITFMPAREALAKALQADVEDVPVWRVRSPLQRAVQLLKRHRDLSFRGEPKLRPVSIIVTTLAARAYEHESDTWSALRGVVNRMPEHIERKGEEWIVGNPVHPEENFADKWNEDTDRRLAFFRWLQKARDDLNELAVTANYDDLRHRTQAKFSAGVLVQSPQVSVAVPDLAPFTHARALQWPERLRFKCQVRGGVYLGVKKRRRLWELTTRPLPKGVGLKFVANTNTPKPYTVMWQVVNTGAEAASEDDLRGGFEESEPKRNGVKWERTHYAGTHWIEAFVVKDGVCVARSGRKYVKVRG